MEKLQGKKEGSSIMVSSPPSASTSPSHEFSFTVSLHNSSSSSSNIVPDNKSKTPPSSSIAIDLTPADDIFFHGHLLPLHLLSHLSVSPRSSTNSLDSFTLPIRELLENDPPLPKPEKTSKSDNYIRTNIEATQTTSSSSSRQQKKSKSFSLFSFTRRQKARVLEVEGNKDEKKHNKRKVRFDISHVLKRYVNMVRPLLFFKGKREKLHNIHRQAYSFSGNLRNKNEEFMKGIRRGEYSSAPASMRTSPTNSGLLVATTPFHSSTSDSTMEELQAAIQAAIAHCKNSIRGEEKLKC